MVKELKDHQIDTKDMRAVYCETLMELAAKDERIVTVNCDLTSSMGLKPFAKEYPQRQFNVGIAESNGVCVAAGMSAAGLVPFFHTFSAFASRRVLDQVFMSCTYAGQNVKIVGGDSGISATYNGGTHMSFEDIGVMSCLPKTTVLEPSDSVMLKSITEQLVDYPGVVYMRMPRKATVKLYTDDSEFKIGEAVKLREGKDATIITMGICVSEALKAADELAERGIYLTVVDLFTVKPIDRACIIDCAKKTGAIVTVENHNVYGGLGSAVAEVLADSCPTPVERIGIRDEFGEVGTMDYLKEKFGLTAPHIIKAVERALLRK